LEFDLQSFLTEMKRDLKEDNKRIEDKIDSCLMTVADHETRVTVIEQTTPDDLGGRLNKVENVIKQLKWVVVTVIGGGVTALIGTFISRFSGGITK